MTAAADAQPFPETLREGGLARPEPTREHDEVARVETCRQVTPEVAHGVGVEDVVGRGGGPFEPDVRRLAADLGEPLVPPELHGPRQLLAGQHGDPPEPDRRLERRADQGGGDAEVLDIGNDADAAQEQRVRVGIEHEGPGRLVVVDRQQPAVRRQGGRDGLDGLAQRVGRRVERRARAERRPDHGVHVSGGLGADAAYAHRHGRLTAARLPPRRPAVRPRER